MLLIIIIIIINQITKYFVLLFRIQCLYRAYKTLYERTVFRTAYGVRLVIHNGKHTLLYGSGYTGDHDITAHGTMSFSPHT